MNDFLQFITFQIRLAKQKLSTFVMIRFLWRPPILWAYPRIPPSV